MKTSKAAPAPMPVYDPLTTSKCLICGERFEKRKPRARCYRCDAPHHDDCAKWNGLKCAVYGCGGKLRTSPEHNQ